MLWRKFKLDWTYAIGELTIVTVGVLIALAVDQWNSDRLTGIEEAAYVSRLMSDIDDDIKDLEYQINAVDQKQESLARVAEQLRSGLTSDHLEFFQDAVIGANYGWNQERAYRATYDDLLGSGNFGLINDHRVRILISDYYDGFENGANRIEERETEYPNLTYELIPRATTIRDDGVVWERSVEPNLQPDRVEKIYQNILDSDLEALTTAFDPSLRESLAVAWAQRPADYVPRTRHLRDDGAPRYINRLFLQSSPYLRQHAHNPLNWHPWGDEAFELARALGRPILLSIGYSTCHWCHVMEEESFDD